MRRIRRFLRRQRGAAIVEFALVVPLFVVLVLGIIMFSRAYTRLNMLNSTLREGARMAATQSRPDSLPFQRLVKIRMADFSRGFGYPIDTSAISIGHVPASDTVSVWVTNYTLFSDLKFLGVLQNITVSRRVTFRWERNT